MPRYNNSGRPHVTDFIQGFMEATKGIPSPAIFREWTAITTVSGALERKTWTEGSARPIYPNLFTLLVGPPGSGKTNAIWKGRELWRGLKPFFVSPDNLTKASLVDAIAKSLRTVIAEDGGSMQAFCALNIACSEFGVFFTAHDTEFLSVLNEIYEGPPSYSEERRTSTNVDIIKPHITMMAGTQPDFLGSFMPEEAWGMGFASRLIMVYADSAPKARIFRNEGNNSSVAHLLAPLIKIYSLKGEFLWTEEAIDVIYNWQDGGFLPRPEHNKLRHYNERRMVHTVKLSMVAAASRAASLTVTAEDVERAKSWLLAAEVKMPDIFYSMAQKSDSQLIDDMHFYIYQLWAANPREKRPDVDEEVLYKFLSEKVPSERVQRIIDQAEKMGVIRQGYLPGSWTPRPRL